MIATEEIEKRILHIARQLAVVHISDGDVLGRMARELVSMLDVAAPDIMKLPDDEE